MSSTTPLQESTNEQQRLDELIADYETRLEDGEDVSPEIICKGNTDLIPAFLDRLEEVAAANSTLSTLAQSAVQPEIPGYRTIHELGRGGSAIVYRAIQLEMDREVAVKVFFPQLHDEGFFEREIGVIKRLKHEGIPAVFDCGRVRFGNADLCWFSMELLTGGAIERTAVCQQSTSDILKLFEKIVQAIHYAHRNGVLHRDIKPANILLDETGLPHVTDFGIAKLIADDQESLSGNTVGNMGTPSYAARELILGELDQPDVRTEVYSLGVLLFEMLTGQHPFEKDAKSLPDLRRVLKDHPTVSVAAHRTNAPIDLDTFVSTLLATDPRDRYESFEIVLAEIQRILNDQPITARRVGYLERAYRWCRTHYVASLATTAGGIVLLVLLIRLVASDLELRRHTAQLELQATNLSRSVDRLDSAIVSSRLRTLQSTVNSERRLALKKLEDETVFATSRRGFSWDLLHDWASDEVIELSGVRGGFEKIQQIEFSESSDYLVISSKPFDLSIVNLQTRNRVSVNEEMQIGSSILFTPDQSGILCQNQQQEVVEVDIKNGNITNRFEVGEPIRQKMAITPGGKFLLGMTVAGVVFRYDLDSEEVLKSSVRHHGLPVTVWTSPDNTRFHLLDRDGLWLTYEIATLRQVERVKIGVPQDASAVSTAKLRAARANYGTSFGLCIALCYSDGECTTYWPAEKNSSRAARTALRVRASPATRDLDFRLPNECVVADSKGAKIFSLIGSPSETRLRPREEEICAVAVSPDGRFIATGGLNGALHVTQQRNTLPRSHLLNTSADFPLRQFGPPIKSLELGQTGRVLICHREGWFSTVAVAENKTCEAFQCGQTECHLALYSTQHKTALLAFRDPDSRLVALRLGDQRLFTSDEHRSGTTPKDQLEADPPHLFEHSFTSRIEEICITSDESMVIVALRSGKFVCLDIQTGEKLAQWGIERDWFRRIVLVAADDQIVSGSQDGRVRWHEARTGKILKDWQAHSDAVNAITVDRKRSMLYTASRSGEIRSWSFDGVRQQRFVGHFDRVSALAVSDDGTTLASGGGDHNVIVWDTISGESQLVLNAHIAPVVDVFFGNDRFLYSTSHDNAVRVWGSKYQSAEKNRF